MNQLLLHGVHLYRTARTSWHAVRLTDACRVEAGAEPAPAQAAGWALPLLDVEVPRASVEQALSFLDLAFAAVILRARSDGGLPSGAAPPLSRGDDLQRRAADASTSRPQAPSSSRTRALRGAPSREGEEQPRCTKRRKRSCHVSCLATEAETSSGGARLKKNIS